MPRSITPPVKGKTIKVVSAITVGGLTPGQRAEVEDNAQTRDFIRGGFWLLLQDAPSEAPESPVEARNEPEAPQTLLGVPDGPESLTEALGVDHTDVAEVDPVIQETAAFGEGVTADPEEIEGGVSRRSRRRK